MLYVGPTGTGRDPAFIRAQIPLGRALTGYFSPEVRGVENIPASGPVLIVGNHSGMFWMPDAWVTGMAVTQRRGTEMPTYSLAYDLLFRVPGLRSFLRRVGVVPASPSLAEELLLGEGAAVIVYPGGDQEACRPRRQANLVDFGGRTGFIRLALRTGVPVVPVVAHGSHHAVFIIWRGESIARALHLSALRIGVFPVMAGAPLGINTVLTTPPPLPAAVIVEFLAALDWSHHGPEAAEDEAVVAACYKEVVSVLQHALTALSTERPHPVATGALRLAERGPLAVARAVGDRAARRNQPDRSERP